jgi:rSAM/selenodomain-associated transferase 1
MTTVLVVAKAPVPGRVKTRLTPPLSSDQAAELHRALLLDTIESCRRELRDLERGVLRLLVADRADASALAALAPGVQVVVQRGRGLAAALRCGVRDHVAEGPCVIVSSDIPGVPAGTLRRVESALADGADVVLGPAMDGGYWLIAMRESYDAPFRAIPWSTPAVWATTLQRCAEADLRVHRLERWRDIDTYADLAGARRELGDTAERTSHLLARLAVPGLDERAPELVSSELLSTSPWRSAIADRLMGADGLTVAYAYLAVPRAVFVVPVTSAGELVLVRQYRHPVRDWTTEVPAGSVDDGESPRAAAKRELWEEVGGRAAQWQHLTTFYSSSAHLSLRSDAFLATGVVLGRPHRDPGETLTVVKIPLDAALKQAQAGGFTEGQTGLVLLLAAPLLGMDTPGG